MYFMFLPNVLCYCYQCFSYVTAVGLALFHWFVHTLIMKLANGADCNETTAQNTVLHTIHINIPSSWYASFIQLNRPILPS